MRVGALPPLWPLPCSAAPAWRSPHPPPWEAQDLADFAPHRRKPRLRARWGQLRGPPAPRQRARLLRPQAAARAGRCPALGSPPPRPPSPARPWTPGTELVDVGEVARRGHRSVALRHLLGCHCEASPPASGCWVHTDLPGSAHPAGPPALQAPHPGEQPPLPGAHRHHQPGLTPARPSRLQGALEAWASSPPRSPGSSGALGPPAPSQEPPGARARSQARCGVRLVGSQGTARGTPLAGALLGRPEAPEGHRDRKEQRPLGPPAVAAPGPPRLRVHGTLSLGHHREVLGAGVQGGKSSTFPGLEKPTLSATWHAAGVSPPGACGRDPGPLSHRTLRDWRGESPQGGQPQAGSWGPPGGCCTLGGFSS